MNCPNCKGKMLEMPIWEDRRKIMEYFLCIDCVPYIRVVKFCMHRRVKYGRPWCIKMDKLCNVESCPTTGYVFCPQIREWQEEEADWVKGQNRNFEDECAECPEKDKCKVNSRQKELDEKLGDDLYAN